VKHADAANPENLQFTDLDILTIMGILMTMIIIMTTGTITHTLTTMTISTLILMMNQSQK
jgi:hypothetical protein